MGSIRAQRSILLWSVYFLEYYRTSGFNYSGVTFADLHR